MATNPRDVRDLTLAVAAEIRQQRAGRGIKQEELAAAADIHQSTLSRMESGKSAIDLEQVDRIAQAFGMKPGDFIDTARKHAAEREQLKAAYRPDGTLDPEEVRGVAESDEHLDEIAAAQRKSRARSARRTSTPVT